MSGTPKINTQMTVIIVAFLALIGFLSWQGKDTAAIIAVGTLLLGGFGFQVAQTQQVKEQTNGNVTALTNQVREVVRYLAVAHPVPPEVVHEIAATPSQAGVVPGPVSGAPMSPPRPPEYDVGAGATTLLPTLQEARSRGAG